MAIVETFGLTRKFGDRVAVDGLTLQVDEGEVLGLLGPNGAGKTTTIRMLAGMIAPTEGHAVLAGVNADVEPERLHEAIGLLTETPGFYSRLSARRNLEFFASFYPGIDREKQVDKYLKLMGLWDRRDDRVGTFSKGMKQRLALARALVHEPKVLFLDEPTSGLDPQAASEVRIIIKELKQAKRTILLSTHNLTEAESLCQRIAVIRGKLLALDAPETLRRRFFQQQIVVQLESLELGVFEVVNHLDYVKDARALGNQLVVELVDAEHNRPELVKAIVGAGGRVLAVSDREHPLEEIYLKLVNEEGKNAS